MLRIKCICVEDLNETPDNDVYADPEIIKTTKRIYKSNKTVLMLSNDQGLSDRLWGSLNDGLESIDGMSAICLSGDLQSIDRQFMAKSDYYYAEHKQDIDLFLTPSENRRETQTKPDHIIST